MIGKLGVGGIHGAWTELKKLFPPQRMQLPAGREEGSVAEHFHGTALGGMESWAVQKHQPFSSTFFFIRHGSWFDTGRGIWRARIDVFDTGVVPGIECSEEEAAFIWGWEASSEGGVAIVKDGHIDDKAFGRLAESIVLRVREAKLRRWP